MNTTVASSILSMVLWAEARGEGELGQRCVASTLWHRGRGDCNLMVMHAQLPDQYAIKRPSKEDKQTPEWAQCMSIAKEMAEGTFIPIVKATHFHANWRQRPSSWWKLKKAAIVGGHTFYWEEKA